jgi:pentatricopeptide repeat protein
MFILWTKAMKVNAHRLRRNGANDAEIILRRVPQPSANMFQIAIFAQAVRQKPIRAQKLLDEMTYLARERKLRYPSTSTIVSCIKAWTKAGGDKALEQADRLVRRLVKLYVEGHQKSPFEVETRLFNDLIMGWRRTGLREAGERSEDVLQLMYDAFNSTGNIAFVPTNYTFHSIIEAWGNSSHPDAGQRALLLLKRMETAPATANSKVEAANTILYASMKSLVRSGNATLIGATNDVYSRMCENYLIGDRSFNLTPKTNTMFLRDFVANPDVLAGVRAENLLRHMEAISTKQGLGHLRPSHFEYNCVMNVYAKKGQIEEAGRLLLEMESRSAFNDVDFEVSATTYNVLILALAERASRDDDERVEQLLKKVLDGHRQGIASLKPDDAFFTSFLFVLAQRKSKDPSLVNRGFHLLHQKRQAGLLPSDMDYGILCKLVLNHGTLDGIDRLIATLKEAEGNSECGFERPLRRSVYVQAMTTCMYHPDTAAKRKGMEIMQHIENQVTSGRSQLTLDRHLYHVLLSGWARSYDRDAFRKAVQLFEKMKSSDNANIQPIIRSYNWVIFAAGRTPTNTKEEARIKFETAMSVFTEAHQSDRLRPDSLTYSNFLFVCSNLLPKGDGRDKVARNVVDLCQKKGLMSRLVYENLSRYFPRVLRAVEESEGVKSGVIPSEWQRNVASEGHRREGKPRNSPSLETA